MEDPASNCITGCLFGCCGLIKEWCRQEKREKEK